MAQSYEYSYSSTGGLGGGAVTGYTVTSEYSTVSSGGDVLLSSGGLGGSASGALLLSSAGSAGGAVQQSATVNQIAQDLLTLNAGSVSGGASAFQTTYVSGGAQVVEASAFSEIEQAILRASNPIQINESEVITVNGQSGIWANKAEVVNWRGVIPITQYIINEDANPEIIRKQTQQQLTYEQEIAIRYLRPPTPPPPGEILIKQEKNIATPPAPPLVIRQQPPRPETPAPLVIREAPPRPPAAVGSKVITISGKRLPPPPRKVIIERLAPLPSKPQSVIIERWLPYNAHKRRVIFQKNTVPDPIIQKPRNVIVQWEPPSVTIKKEFKDLGVIRANPSEYVSKYGASLKASIELPSFVREIRPPTGVVLAAEYQAPSLLELEGDVQALSLIDLDQWGLSEYRTIVTRYGGASFGLAGAGGAGTYAGTLASGSSAGGAGGAGGASFGLSGGASYGLSGGSTTTYITSTSTSSNAALNAALAEIFASVDLNSSGRITLSEGEVLLAKLNQRLGRTYNDADLKAFFRTLDSNRDGSIDFEEFRRAILRYLA